jgi:eukaryotic-like serine/threonine-protein kinase
MQRLGKYEIIERLGAGGMAVVYRARDTMLDRDVALKVINHRSEEGAADPIFKRFLHEAKISAGLTHPNIVVIYELGTEEGLPFIAMEYLPGSDLQELLRSGTPLDLSQKLDIVLQIARALEHAHSRGVIHRDIKPANIRVLASGQAKLVDFGIAKANEADMTRLTRPGTVLGTIAYMSPEQLMGETLDPASDVFSFGVVLYELLTGRRPFEGSDLASLVFKITQGEPSPFTELDATLPEPLRKIVLRCLANSPQQRYPGFGPIIQDLSALKQAGTRRGPPPSARPPQEPAESQGRSDDVTESGTAEITTVTRPTDVDADSKTAEATAAMPVEKEPGPEEEPQEPDEVTAALPMSMESEPDEELQEPDEVTAALPVGMESEPEKAPQALEPHEPDEEPRARTGPRLALALGGLIGVASFVAWGWLGSGPDSSHPTPTPLPTAVTPRVAFVATAPAATPSAEVTAAPAATPPTEVATAPAVPPPSATASAAPPSATASPLPSRGPAGATHPTPAASPLLSSATPTARPLDTATPSMPPTISPSITPTSVPTETPTPSITPTPTATPTVTPTLSPSLTPTPEHTLTPTPDPKQRRKATDARATALEAKKRAEEIGAERRLAPAMSQAASHLAGAERALQGGRFEEAAAAFAQTEKLYLEAVQFNAQIALAEQFEISARYKDALSQIEPIFDRYGSPGPYLEELQERLTDAQQAVDKQVQTAEQKLDQGDVKSAWEALSELTATQRALPQVKELLGRIEYRIKTDREPPQIQVLEPSYLASKPFVLEVRVLDASGIASVLFHSRCQDEEFFEPASMEKLGNGTYRATVDPARHKNKTIRYYIEAVDVAGNRSSSGSVRKPFQASPSSH